MKCLSVKNPNSFLICSGVKKIENRTWKTDYRGVLYIFSSGIYEKTIYDEYIPDKIQKDELIELDETKKLQKLLLLNRDNNNLLFQSGYVIGKVNLVDIIRDSDNMFAEKNNFHWILENPELFEKKDWKKCKGKLKIFDI